MINLTLLIVPLMGLTMGALNIATEREQGSLLYLLAQPVNSTEVLLGKFLGLALSLFSAIVFGFGLSGILIARRGGVAEVGSYISLVLFSFLLALASLSLGLLISSTAKTISSASGIALFSWLALVFLGDLGVMGTAMVLKLKLGVLLTTAFLNPLQLFKMATIYSLQSSLEVLGPAGIFAIRTYGTKLMPMLLAGLVFWAVIPLTIAIQIMKKRGAL